MIMKVRLIAIITLAGGLAISGAAFAQSAYPSSSSLDATTGLIGPLQKQEQMDNYKAQYWSQEPLIQQDYYVQARQDRRLIRELSAGQPVSADQVQQALRHVDTPY
jgi:hypothetical protein